MSPTPEDDLTSEDAKVALQFLGRTDLKGREAIAMARVQIKLSKISAATSALPPDRPGPDRLGSDGKAEEEDELDKMGEGERPDAG